MKDKQQEEEVVRKMELKKKRKGNIEKGEGKKNKRNEKKNEKVEKYKKNQGKCE